MNNIAKVLLGIGVVGAIAATTYVVTKSTEKKTVVVRNTDEEGNTKTEIIEDKSVLEQIKEAALKKVVKILAWAVLHEDQIRAAASVIGLGASLFSIFSAIKDFRTGNEMRSQINELVAFKDAFQEVWDKSMDCHGTAHDQVMTKLDDIHLDMSMLHELHEALLVSPKKVVKKTA